ncbi:unnamed protein product [Allacma fusca]|uniref:Secreted protein n=1 Tax=Allacma fusca TaxID=39272 RepID=A0A8J2K7C6_9HEXA|nr:unnamed protein product [Allacma fusca]
MKLLVLLALSITISTVYSSGTRRSDNNPPTDAGKERDTPFWAPRGKKNSLADSVRCGYLRQFEDTDDEPNWMELDSSERFYDKNLEPWNSRLKRSLALGGKKTSIFTEY